MSTPYVSDAHLRVQNYLEARGVQLIEEVKFTPYTVDVWVPELHMAVEIDGPQHMRKKDLARDAVLVGKYSLYVLHVKHDISFDELFERFTIARLDAMMDSTQRWEKCRRKTPWL